MIKKQIFMSVLSFLLGFAPLSARDQTSNRNQNDYYALASSFVKDNVYPLTGTVLLVTAGAVWWAFARKRQHRNFIRVDSQALKPATASGVIAAASLNSGSGSDLKSNPDVNSLSSVSAAVTLSPGQQQKELAEKLRIQLFALTNKLLENINQQNYGESEVKKITELSDRLLRNYQNGLQNYMRLSAGQKLGEYVISFKKELLLKANELLDVDDLSIGDESDDESE